MRQTATWVFAAVFVSFGVRGGALPVPVPNPSFEEGDTTPTGWVLSGGIGRWGTVSGRSVTSGCPEWY